MIPAPGDALLVLGLAEARLHLVLGRAGPSGAPPQLLAAQDWLVAGQANQTLAPAVASILRPFFPGPAPLASLAGVACVAGPGSFTGLRLTMAFAEGVRAGLGTPLAGLPWLPCLARSVRHRLDQPPERSDLVWIMTHARKGLVYLQSFAPDGPGDAAAQDFSRALPQTLPQVLALADALETLAAHEGPALLAGGATRLHPAPLAELLARRPSLRLLPPLHDAPDPASLLAQACQAAFEDAPLVPLYLRPSDAEENLDAIAIARGIDPVQARKTLELNTSSEN